MPGRHRLDGKREHALALARHRLGARPPERFIKSLVAGWAALAAAHREDALRRALDIGEGAVFMAVMQRRHELMLGIEGNFVGAGKLLA